MGQSCVRGMSLGQSSCPWDGGTGGIGTDLELCQGIRGMSLGQSSCPWDGGTGGTVGLSCVRGHAGCP